MAEEVLRELAELRERLRAAYLIEERGVQAYTDTLPRLRSRLVHEVILAVALESLIHLRVLDAMLTVLDEVARELRRAQARPLEAGYEDVKRFYEALRRHLELEKGMLTAMRRVVELAGKLEAEHRGDKSETLYRLVRRLAEAITANEEEHTAKIGKILSLAQPS